MKSKHNVERDVAVFSHDTIAYTILFTTTIAIQSAFSVTLLPSLTQRTHAHEQRDFAWCIKSAPLVSAGDVYPSDSFFESLTVDSQSHFPPVPHPHRFRLGQHFEHIWQAWFAQQNEFELILSNLQVRNSKRTLGEFDFIVEHCGHIEHWEVAIKFYLGYGDLANPASWHGPNTTDKLAIKLARLNEHQLRLSELPEAQSLLEERGLTVRARRCVVKGRLFYPLKQFLTSSCEPPECAAPNHEQGWWLPRDEFAYAFEGCRFVLLEKINWLSRLEGIETEAASSLDEFLTYLHSDAVEQATHVAVIDKLGHEQSRGFVVNERWLARASNTEH